MNIQLLAFNCRYSHSCLALFYVRNELERNLPSCTTTLEQFTINDPYYETLLRITGSEADALCFSVYIWNATYLKRLLTDIHRLRPAMPLVLGGPQAAALREGLSGAATVVHGEIEGVDRTFYLDLQGGALQSDYFGSAVTTFNSPYKQEDFSRQLKNRNIYYEASRGCPFFCAYCLSSISRGVRVKAVDQVKMELLAILAHGPAMIRFVDRTFNADPQRTLAIWRFLDQQRDTGCTFHFEIAPDLFSEAMFLFLEGVTPGLFQFEIGIQSTNPDTLAAVNRKMDVPRALATISRLKGIGTIHLHVDLILGLPLETAESFANSVRQCLATEPHQLQMGLLKILPDTAIAHGARDFGIIACQEPPYQVMATSWLDHHALSRLYWLGECIEAFYNKGYFQTFFAFCIREEADIFSFFEQLLAHGHANGLFALAKTQQLMSDILFSFVRDHGHALILQELLVFDWLLCGHRFLPEMFTQDINADKEFLWQTAAAELEGLYTARERNHFFKKGIFCRFSARLLAHCRLGEGDVDGFVGFFKAGQPGKTMAVVIPLPGQGAPS
jgi:hypothetical protein